MLSTDTAAGSLLLYPPTRDAFSHEKLPSNTADTPLSNVTLGVYVVDEPCSKLSVEGGDHDSTKLDSEPERVKVRLPFQLPIVACTGTAALDMPTTRVDWPADAKPGSPTRQLTADATAARVAALVLHAATTCTRWYSSPHGIFGTDP